MPLIDDWYVEAVAARWAPQLTPEQMDLLAVEADTLVELVGCTHRQAAELMIWAYGAVTLSRQKYSALVGAVCVRALESQRSGS